MYGPLLLLRLTVCQPFTAFLDQPSPYTVALSLTAYQQQPPFHYEVAHTRHDTHSNIHSAIRLPTQLN